MYTLSTRRRNESTSMSKRAPSAEAVPVRRATQPSTPSSASATMASPTSVVTGVWRANESAVSAATPPTSVARASVTRSAGPSAADPESCRPRVSEGTHDDPVREPDQPSRAAETDGAGEGRQQGDLACQSDQRTSSNRGHCASVTMRY